MQLTTTLAALSFVLAVIVWLCLPDRSWNTLAPNVFFAFAQMTMAFVVTDIIVRRHRRKYVDETCGVTIGVALDLLERAVFEYAEKRLRGTPLRGRKLSDDLEAEACRFEHRKDSISAAIEKYRDLLETEELALLMRLQSLVGAFSYLGKQKMLDEQSYSTSLCHALHDMLACLKLLSRHFSYTADMKRFRRIELFMARHHWCSFTPDGRISSPLWRLRRMMPF